MPIRAAFPINWKQMYYEGTGFTRNTGFSYQGRSRQILVSIITVGADLLLLCPQIKEAKCEVCFQGVYPFLPHQGRRNRLGLEQLQEPFVVQDLDKKLNSNAVLIMFYDAHDVNSFKLIKERFWGIYTVSSINLTNALPLVLLLGLCSDTKTKVLSQEAQSFAEKNGIFFGEITTNQNILFTILMQAVVAKTDEFWGRRPKLIKSKSGHPFIIQHFQTGQAS